MNNTYIVAAVALIVLIGGGVYVSMMPGGQAMEKKDAMMEKTGDAMMEKGDSMMKEDGAMMEKDGAMMEKKDGEAMMEKKDGAMMEKAPEGAMMSAGSYEAYAPEKLAKASEGDVVLFFRASWCPTCRTLDSDIKKNAGAIPKGVTILDVNYDDSTALKQKYGVTQQHTLVQVAADGSVIGKWSGGSTLTSLVGNIK
ncbi:MAG: thioredoxin family protein [Candidatus Pacebacteria bacterium]|nr:thioredoxin family protein [Candidatus Paceibacterota bacterium]